MFSGKALTALALSAAMLAASTLTVPTRAAGAKQKTKARKSAGVKSATGTRAAVLAAVDQFEKAYQRKDKKTMLFKLMMPTSDAMAMEKRYQWWRGYGPKDPAGTKHQPILFETSKGSFVPTTYKVLDAAPTGTGSWSVAVREEGTYKDEDGRYKVSRVRHFKMSQQKGKWYVLDYVLKENPEDYGFWVDDIIDKMTPMGK